MNNEMEQNTRTANGSSENKLETANALVLFVTSEIGFNQKHNWR